MAVAAPGDPAALAALACELRAGDRLTLRLSDGEAVVRVERLVDAPNPASRTGPGSTEP